MRFVDEYRNEADAQKLLARHRADGDAAVDDHGDLRRADAHADQVRHRPDAAAAGHAGARARLPGLRHAARADRPARSPSPAGPR